MENFRVKSFMSTWREVLGQKKKFRRPEAVKRRNLFSKCSDNVDADENNMDSVSGCCQTTGWATICLNDV